SAYIVMKSLIAISGDLTGAIAVGATIPTDVPTELKVVLMPAPPSWIATASIPRRPPRPHLRSFAAIGDWIRSVECIERSDRPRLRSGSAWLPKAALADSGEHGCPKR